LFHHFANFVCPIVSLINPPIALPACFQPLALHYQQAVPLNQLKVSSIQTRLLQSGQLYSMVMAQIDYI